METATRRRRRPLCSICQAELPWHRSLIINYDRLFCSAHARQYHIRQRRGVSTEELDTRWSDAVDNWRERPRALDQERGTRGDPFSRMYFTQRVEGWMLFQRSYSYWPWQRPPGIRHPDTLALNQQTGDVRRFVSVGLDEVLDDLPGSRPALHQAELWPYWGRPLPPGFYERLAQPYLDARGLLQVLSLLQAAPFPIYGLADQPLGLTVCSAGCQSAGFRLRSVGFCFSSPRYPQARKAVRIGSAANTGGAFRPPNTYGFAYNAEATAGASSAQSHPPDAQLFEFYRLSAAEQAQAGDPVVQQVALTIAQESFTGERYFWAHPYPLSWFYLTSEKTRLAGSALGPSEEELLHLLEGLVVLNERADLGAEYQLELDQERARLAQYDPGGRVGTALRQRWTAFDPFLPVHPSPP